MQLGQAWRVLVRAGESLATSAAITTASSAIPAAR
jgi:hypothetical protein